MMAIAFLGYIVSLKCSEILEPSYILKFKESSIICSIRLQNILEKYNIKPIAIFENLQKIGAKSLAYNYLKPLSGVYLIVNLINENCYVGSAITSRLHRRLHSHLFGLSGNKHLANAVKKYRLDNFAFILLETIPGFIDSNKNKDLLALENKYIKLLNPKYNKTPNAGNTLGYTHKPETILKLKGNYSEERRNRIGELNRGKKLSAATRSIISKKALARAPVTPETRSLISANSAKAGSYIISNLDNYNSVTLRTIPVAAKYCNCSEKTIRRALNGNGIIKRIWRICKL
jgi:group I intron endonuclease